MNTGYTLLHDKKKAAPFMFFCSLLLSRLEIVPFTFSIIQCKEHFKNCTILHLTCGISTEYIKIIFEFISIDRINCNIRILSSYQHELINQL